MTEKQKTIEALTVSIEIFMAKIPGDDDRPWTSTEMATALYDAGYRLPVKDLSPISEAKEKLIDSSHYQIARSAWGFFLKGHPDANMDACIDEIRDGILEIMVEQKLLAADRKATEKGG